MHIYHPQYLHTHTGSVHCTFGDVQWLRLDRVLHNLALAFLSDFVFYPFPQLSTLMGLLVPQTCQAYFYLRAFGLAAVHQEHASPLSAHVWLFLDIKYSLRWLFHREPPSLAVSYPSPQHPSASLLVSGLSKPFQDLTCSVYLFLLYLLFLCAQ